MKNYVFHIKEEINKVREEERSGVLYSLWRVENFDDRFVIKASGGGDFYCGTLFASDEEAERVFCEIVESETPPFAVADIVDDVRCKNILYKSGKMW